MTLSQDDIVHILNLLDQSSYEDLDLQTGDFRLTVSKTGNGHAAAAPQRAAQVAAPAAAPAIAAPAPQPAAAAAPAAAPVAAVDQAGLLTIASPMLGAFYRSAKPGDPAFVEVGSMVEENDTVCLIEVMKTYTTVPAGVRGRVVKILVDDTAMVEHHQALFLIEPA